MKPTLPCFLLFLCVCINALPLNQPHNDMASVLRAGTDAVAHVGDNMVDVAECDGEIGSIPQIVYVWPSPPPLPTISEIHSLPIVSITTSNSTSNVSLEISSSESSSETSSEATCQDDEAFLDNKGLNCRDYLMNKEMCKKAEMFASASGQNARHACCKCGGGSHIVPIAVRKCVPIVMGGDNGCDQDKHATLAPVDAVDAEMTQKMGGSVDYDQVIMDDEVEENALDRLGTVASVDGVLGPDSIVFRDRNFIGNPKDPDNQPAKPNGEYLVSGSIAFNLRFDPFWKSVFGARVMTALSSSALVHPHGVSLINVRPLATTSQATNGIRIDYEISPDAPATREAAMALAMTLTQGFASGNFMRDLTQLHFPAANLTILTRPQVEEATEHMDASLAYENTYKHYTTKPYIVEAKETIATIADKFSVSPSLIVAFNQAVADPMLIKEGDILQIPVPRILQITSVHPSFAPLEGGSEIIITGSGFIHPAYCKFGDRLTEADYVVDDTIVCVTPEQKEPGMYSFSVSDGKGGFQESPFQLNYTVGMLPFCDEPDARPSWCRPRMSIYAVLPIRIPQDTETSIQIIGSGFNSSTICFIGGEERPTIVWSRSNVTCNIPPSSPGAYSVVLHQGNLLSTTKFEIVVYSTLAISSITPERGSEHGGTELHIEGVSFRENAVCRFGELMVPAIVHNSTHMTCITPPHEAEIVNVDVSNDRNFFSPTSIAFEFTRLVLHSIMPTEGHVTGGDTITLHGDGFYPDSWCRFGPNRTLAEYVDRNTIRCISPPQSISAQVTVSVSLDGLKYWTEDEVLFAYYSEITEIRPTEGRSIGGDDIHVFGHGFTPYEIYVCKFGEAAVQAVVITPTQLQCLSPPGAGVVEFTLETLNRRFRKNAVGELMTFTYHGAQDIDIFGAFPGFTDVRSPNTTVTLRGEGFTEGTLCRFGDKSSPSIFVDSSTITCVAPMRDLAEIVPVFVSHDGGKSWSETLTYFEYRAVVKELLPPMGHVDGGDLIVVNGYGFNYRVSLCVFGNHAVRANVSSQYQLSCVAPKSAAPTKVPFAVTCNTSTLYDPYLEFRFKHPDAKIWGTWYVYSENPRFYVKAISPEVGTTMGGSEVFVYGEGFDRTSHCMFGDTTVKAEFLDAATVKCITPPHLPGDVEFKVVLFNQTEGYNISVLGVPYRFSPPTISSIEPNEGYVSGGDLVTIKGSFLAGAVSCRFGKSSSPVLSVSENEVKCQTPQTEVASTVPVELIYGIAGASSGDVVFVYHPVVNAVSPQNGYISTSNQKISFRGVGFAGDPTQCVFEGQTFVPATIVSDSEIQCSVPSVSTPRTVKVYLTTSKQSTLGGQQFDFKYNPLIQDVHPNVGSSSGDTTVVVIGSGLTTVTHCSFGTQRVRATVVSDMMARCKSPAHAPGITSLTLIADTGINSSTFTTNPFEFTYKIMSTRVDSLYPTIGSIGGGSLVTVRGSGFTLGSFCKFGDVEVPVMYFSPENIACFTPKVDTTQTVTLEVSQVGGGEGYSNDHHTFTFYANVSTVNRIEPTFASEGQEIRVIGSNFAESSVCFFGGRQAIASEFVSSSEMKCTVPPIGSRTDEIVQVTSDPAQLPGGHVVFHYDVSFSSSETPAVREVSPNEGPTSGNTLVTVTGINFPEQPLCRFGDLYTQGQFVSSTEVRCLSPQHRAAIVVLEITSQDKQTFSASFVRFSFKSAAETASDDLLDSIAVGEPSIERISPSSARVGETISLIGQQFSSVGFCAFSSPTSTLKTDATVVDSSHVSCTVPEPLSDMGVNVSVKYVAISGLESSSLPFTYVL